MQSIFPSLPRAAPEGCCCRSKPGSHPCLLLIVSTVLTSFDVGCYVEGLSATWSYQHWEGDSVNTSQNDVSSRVDPSSRGAKNNPSDVLLWGSLSMAFKHWQASSGPDEQLLWIPSQLPSTPYPGTADLDRTAQLTCNS